MIHGRLDIRDILGSWKARWGIGRMTYIVPPGLYAIGRPDADAPVVVTANYKMSYDLVRSTLAERHVWLLVLETFGINVWCAAGKGTFGTGELVRRVTESRVSEVVRHRCLTLPIMGAAGVKAVEVRKRTGFDVRFATLRISDLPRYLDRGGGAEPAMRELTFSVHERLVLAPIEIVSGMKSLLPVGIPLALLAGCSGGHFSLSRAAAAVALYIGALLCGTLVTPLLLPMLPGRMFSIKGAASGMLFAVAALLPAVQAKMVPVMTAAAFSLIVPSVSAFYAMNFTGSTPFTSPSGVRKEMRFSLPVMLSAAVAGVLVLLVGVFSS